VVRSLATSAAMVGQYLVPALCLIAALISYIGRRKRETLHALAGAASTAAVLNGMSWHEFEMLVGEAFRRRGYSVTELGGAGADGGIDLILRKGRETSLVQCKQWKATVVGVTVVRELYGVMAAKGATSGYVVTSGSFSADAQAFARGLNIELIGGPRLFEMIRQARLAADPLVPTAAPTATAAPTCPKCNAQMVLRTAGKGAKAGSPFWGCSKFPGCRGTR
jgi:restriction system protein